MDSVNGVDWIKRDEYLRPMMTFDEIREASKRQLASERAQAGEITETTPPAITDKIVDFAAKLGGPTPAYVPVVDDPFGLYGWCSDGVIEKVRHDGGSIVFGWTIWEWPNVMLTAEFHAVWRDLGGKLQDITPKPAEQSRILFQHDPSYPEDFNFDNRPRNRRTPLYPTVDAHAQVTLRKSNVSVAQLNYEERRAAKAGLSLDDWLLSKVKPDEFSEAVDQRFVSLARERLRLQERVKKSAPKLAG
ncbi:hypothetical protein [Aurantiacibacter sp. D1-12]|uniref:hypothetical protein n=1 Tax=Aurantiacibacter sp. D1-12 TaxID=2993658 RepID=UPI00237CAF52|nr:hypothetical protein [Aurantiacibacter sp. D1-12]MDE1468482.1 hypothetical protein [Aurantiacibacter sp. D1-12]